MFKLSTLVRAFRSAFVALLLVGAFQLLKSLLFPRLSMAASHIATTLFCALLAFVLSLYITHAELFHSQLIRDQKNNLETLVQHLPGLACVVDTNTKLVQWNSRFQSTLGYTADELRQMRAPETIAEDYRALVPQKMGEAWETGSSEMEAAWLTKSGERIPCYLTGLRIQVAHRPCVLSVGIDISKGKRAEEALRKSEERYRRLLANLPDVTWTAKSTGQTTYMSPNVEEVFGYTAEEFCQVG